MVQNPPSRVVSHSTGQQRLTSVFAGLLLASAAAQRLAALPLLLQAGVHGHASTRAAEESRDTRMQSLQMRQKIAEDKRQLAVEQSRLDTLLHAPSNATPGNAESQESPELLTVRDLRAQLTEKRRHLSELQENYTDLYPDVIATREQITELQSKLERAEAAVHLRPAPAVRAETAAGRDQELEKIRAAIEEKTKELAQDEASASRSDKPHPVRSSGRLVPRHSVPMQQEAAAADVTTVVLEPPSIPTPVAPTARPATPSAFDTHSTSTASRTVVALLLIGFGILAAAGAVVFLLRAGSKSRNRTLQDSAQLRALLPDVVLIGSIPRMKPQ